MLVGVSTSQATLAYGHHVLDPHAPFAGEVYSRLNRDDHTGPQYFFLPGCDPRRFVNLQAHAMPGRVRKIATQSRLAQHLAGRLVHFRYANSGPDSRNRRLLRFPHRFVRGAARLSGQLRAQLQPIQCGSGPNNNLRV